MLKEMAKRKIIISSLMLFALFLIYLVPNNRKEVEFKDSNIEYTYDNIKSTIYLVDSNNYVARTSISSKEEDTILKIKDLVEGLIIGGKKSSIIPNGFRSIIPSGTIINSVKVEEGTAIIDFSKEILDINKDEEELMIEALIYTVTSIDNITNLKITVDSIPLLKLPSGRVLPSILSKSYGINKKYELTSTNNVSSYTVYYVNEYNDNKYYVPVTKYVNNSDDKVKVIIKDLSSSPIYETNLMSYLNSAAKVTDYKLNDDNLNLYFNKMLLNDIDSDNILEEVIYTIGLSLNDNYDNLKKVNFFVDEKEVYSLDIKDINN